MGGLRVRVRKCWHVAEQVAAAHRAGGGAAAAEIVWGVHRGPRAWRHSGVCIQGGQRRRLTVPLLHVRVRTAAGEKTGELRRRGCRRDTGEGAYNRLADHERRRPRAAVCRQCGSDGNDVCRRFRSLTRDGLRGRLERRDAVGRGEVLLQASGDGRALCATDGDEVVLRDAVHQHRHRTFHLRVEDEQAAVGHREGSQLRFGLLMSVVVVQPYQWRKRRYCPARRGGGRGQLTLPLQFLVALLQRLWQLPERQARGGQSLA